MLFFFMAHFIIAYFCESFRSIILCLLCKGGDSNDATLLSF